MKAQAVSGKGFVELFRLREDAFQPGTDFFEIESCKQTRDGDADCDKLRDMLPLPREFYARDPITVAHELLGKLLVRQTPAGTTSGRIVEAEAYLSSRDPACHASRGMTPRNRTMFGPAGHTYVYAIHARWCLNAVTEGEGLPSAVLIRAIEPLAGIELMQARRQREELLDLARGPARLCEALAVTKAFDGWDLTAARELWIADDQECSGPQPKIGRSPRIGVTSAQSRLLRFYLVGNPYVSGRRANR